MSKARDIARAGTALSSVDATELGYLDGVTSNVQTQIDAKLATATAASTYLTQANAATTYQAINTNVSTTELGYLDGVTSAIQTQLNAKAPTASPSFTGTVSTTATAGGTSAYFTDAVNSSLVVANLAGGVTLGTDAGGAIHLATNGAASGNRRLSIDNAGATTVNYTTTTGGAVRNIYMSTSTPSGGSDGDVWIQYA